MSRILKVERESDFVRYTIEAQGQLASENRKITCHEAPLLDFDLCMKALAGVAINLMGLPESWRVDMTVKSLTIRYTKSGTRKVVISWSQFFHRTSSTETEKTPEFFIEDGAEGEDFRRECDESDVETIMNFLHEAQRYINGERQQQLLPLPDPEEDPIEPSDGDLLDFSEDETPWHKRDIPFHPDTDIPDLGGMEVGHAKWYITMMEDKADLKQVIQFNFATKLDGRQSLDQMKEAACELLGDE